MHCNEVNMTFVIKKNSPLKCSGMARVNKGYCYYKITQIVQKASSYIYSGQMIISEHHRSRVDKKHHCRH